MKYNLEFWDEEWDKYSPYTDYGEYDDLEKAKEAAKADSNGIEPLWSSAKGGAWVNYTDSSKRYYGITPIK
jgi:hypothetical protein